jgi:transcriptional regulator with XRE-family HTH domain
MAGQNGLSGLGSALRRLRVHRDLKQFETAGAAGITKAMLSAYETGRRRPSLKTLSRLLEALDADLGDLHRALVAESYGDAVFGGRGGRARRPAVDAPYPVGAPGAALEVAEPPDVYQVLGVDRRLAPAEEVALSEMLSGFHNLLRYLHRHRPPGPRKE